MIACLKERSIIIYQMFLRLNCKLKQKISGTTGYQFNISIIRGFRTFSTQFVAESLLQIALKAGPEENN